MAKKWILPFALLFLVQMGLGQEGMQFTNAKNWEEVKAQAKKENKYIFLDAYTTWCGPCIMMAKKIFPLPEVGAFFNERFINLKVQLDTTSRDNEHVKNWHPDGHMLATTYNIKAYPTYLFFSPDGEIVHRAVGSSDAATFIGKAKDALDASKQYYTLVRSFDKGERNPVFLQNLLQATMAAYDKANLPRFAKAFYQTQKDLLSTENAKLLANLTESTRDTGFVLMMKNPEVFARALNKPGVAESMVIGIILRDQVYPLIRTEEEDYDPAKVPDWTVISAKLEKQYPGFGEAALLRGKIMFFRAREDFPQFSQAVSELLQKNGKALPAEMLNSYAWDIFESCEDRACILQALNWSKKSLENNEDPMYLDTYANLLHKSGKTKEAIAQMEKAISISKKAGEDTEGFEDTLAKMKKGEQTW